ncbi:carnitine O-octanoyltransferase isoform X2 [Lycorma delicatula]
MTGPSPTTELGWKYGPGKQVLFAARYCYHTVTLWLLLRQERYRPTKIKDRSTGKIKIFNMNQYRRLFNTCQIPRKSMDQMICYFKTEAEGDCPAHVIVLYKGRVYKMESFHPDGSQLSTAEWQKVLTLIVEDAMEKEEFGSNISCLTSQNRDSWAVDREYLISLDKQNEEYLHAIETSMFILCLDDDSPTTESDVSHLNLTGNLSCRWPDKSLNIIFFNNGSSCGLSNHAAYDGIVSVTTMHFLHLSLAENRDNWQESVSVRPGIIKPLEIEFIVDSKIKQKINDVLLDQQNTRAQYIMTHKEFNNFGKDEIQRRHHLHPDGFIQMALQLTYYKMHGRPVPCYETANTRSYYRGRTETHRSCTNEAVNWVKAMVDETKNATEKASLLKLAIKRHVKLLKDAENNAGCDRHLFGLQCVAMENSIPMPQLFTDPSYFKSGGGGNFILSTSLVGYTLIGGGVMPMCLDGYGCFYNITSSSIGMSLSVCRYSNETSADKFFRCFSETLLEMNQLPSSVEQVDNKSNNNIVSKL